MGVNKEKLILALAEERKQFFLKGYRCEDHDLTIKYLRTGEIPTWWDETSEEEKDESFSLLCAAIDASIAAFELFSGVG